MTDYVVSGKRSINTKEMNSEWICSNCRGKGTPTPHQEKETFTKGIKISVILLKSANYCIQFYAAAFQHRKKIFQTSYLFALI